ncbi:MAG: ammonium transporter [Armatimonadota bacterium]|nr:ammonium transporter [Armatimonadota bacterium]
MRRTRMLAWVIATCAILSVGLSVAALAADPAGVATGGATDVVGATPGSPTADDLKTAEKTEPVARKLADTVGQNRVAINLVWTLVAAFLVMFMQAGFALVETGFTRAKNAAHTMFMNFSVYSIGIIGFYICGFALMYGAAGAIGNLGGTPTLAGGHEVAITLFGKKFGLFGASGFLLSGQYYDAMVCALFLFQMVFMDTAVTIPTGAMAERWKLSAFLVYGLFMSMILYPIFGNWAWGGGWLSQLGANFGLGNGYADFAGSGVVHAVGGLCALAGAIVLGPRIGKFNRDGSANAIPGHHIPMAILGTFILAFGWFGFNPGSALGASGAGNLRIALVATTTMLASASGAAAAVAYMLIKMRKPDPTMAANGMLAGLVAITAPCAFVTPGEAFIIGAVAGVLVCAGVSLLDKIHVDDPVGAVAVHGMNGLWGVVAVGLFADGTYGGGLNGVAHTVTGLFHGGGFGQLGAQLIGVMTLGIWAFGASFVFFTLQKKIMGIRVSKEDEIAGLDMPETGVLAYPEFELR